MSNKYTCTCCKCEYKYYDSDNYNYINDLDPIKYRQSLIHKVTCMQWCVDCVMRSESSKNFWGTAKYKSKNDNVNIEDITNFHIVMTNKFRYTGVPLCRMGGYGCIKYTDVVIRKVASDKLTPICYKCLDKVIGPVKRFSESNNIYRLY